MLILDGSHDPLDNEVLRIFSRAPDLQYIHAPVSFSARLRLAEDAVTTPYAVLGGDDEFLLLNGLHRAIRKLEEDLTLVSCIGQSIAFFPTKTASHCTYDSGYPHWGYSVPQTSPIDRLAAALSTYTAATAYAVMRSSAWKRSYCNLQNWTSPYAGEMQQAMSTYISGKLATVDDVYWMRSSENKPINTGDFNRGRSFQEWWSSPGLRSEHRRFVEILGKELVQGNNLCPSEAEAHVTHAINTFVLHMNEVVSKAAESSYKSAALRSKLRASLVKLLKHLLPDQLQQRFKALLFDSRHTKGVQGHFGTLSTMMKYPNPPFLLNSSLVAELAAVEELIAGFYASGQTYSK